MLANLRARSTLQLHSVRDWIVHHDDSWLFLALYIGLAVVLSIWISLFWLVAVVGVHFAFEWVRQQTLRSGFSNILFEVLWELKLDIALVLFALALSLYMDVVLGIVGLRSAARLAPAAQAGLRSSTRFAAWQRVIRGVLLSVDDAAQVARAVTVSRSDTGAGAAGAGAAGAGAAGAGAAGAGAAGAGATGAEPVESEATAAGAAATPGAATPVAPYSSWRGRWSMGDWISAALGAACIVLILLAPSLTEHSFASATATLATELHPFPWLAAGSD
jgi:hypothetical protein